MKKDKTDKKDSYGIYLFYGILTAVIVTIAMLLSQSTPDKDPVNLHQTDSWSEEADSSFVKMCFDKYKTQVKGDLDKQENTKAFCRCMLEKIKTKYNEFELRKMTDTEIKQWDTECRSQLMKPEIKQK